MRDLWPYLQLFSRHRNRLLLGALLMLLTTLAAAGLLALSGWFITATAVTAMVWAAGVNAQLDIYTPGGGIRFFAIARTVSRYFERLYNHDTVLRLLADLRTTVFSALTRLDAQTLGRLKSAVLLNRLTADIDALDNLYLRLLAPPVVAFVATLAVAAFLIVFVPAAGILVFIVLVLMLICICWLFANRMVAISAELLLQAETLRVRLLEQFHGLAELMAYGTLAEHGNRLQGKIHAWLLGQKILGCRIAQMNAVVTWVVQALSVAVLVIAISAYQADLISAPVMVMLPLVILALAETFLPLPAAFAHYGQTRAAARRLTDEVREVPATVVSAPAIEHKTPAACTLQIAQLTFQYPFSEAPAINNLNLQLAAGERLAVLGSSGSGKSTLAQLLMQKLSADTGSIRLDGTALAQWPAALLHERVGWLTQRTELFADSIAANLRIAAPSASDAALWSALHSVALAELVSNSPDGLATWIGESGRKLSGGEGRRLALARLLLRDPGLVLLDEPLTGLDAATATTVRERLEHWLTGRTVIFFAHSANNLPPVDHVIELSA
ncbi:MAG: thiol reductant ABC exporter subunit CydC [Gammaproteobacteria bacterium]